MLLTNKGPYSCIGKQLALMELRYVVAYAVHRYDIKLASGQTEREFLTGKKDTFTLSPGPLNLVFKKRRMGE
jgi:cytochrome P450